MNNDTYYKLANHPLLFVLAEFRFTEIMNIEKFLPEIQDSLRQEFPFYETQTLQEINITPEGVKIDQSKQWAFIDKTRKNSVLLNHKRLIFITSGYERFEGFKQHCEIALEALISVAHPSFITRIGLRYADLITAKDGYDITEYVQSNICKESHLRAVGRPVRQINESFLETREGSMVIRSMYGDTDTSVFNDMGNMPIKVATQDEPSERILLDFDHFWQPDLENSNIDNNVKLSSFEKSAIIEKLEGMHELSRQAFWDITTETGRKAWE